MKTITYVPHGGIPDRRGFAPALVASEIARRLLFCENHFVCNREAERHKSEVHPELGKIWRIRETWAYRKLFRKITRLDPLPLHRDLAKLVRRIRPELLHVHQIEFPVNDFRRMAGDVPLLIHNHVGGHRFCATRGAADGYVAVSEHVRQDMLKEGWPAEKIHVIPNGVDTGLFRPLAVTDRTRIKAILGIPEDAPVLVFFGRKMEIKGYEVFIETACRLVKAFPDLWVMSAGPEPADAQRDASFVVRRQGLETLRQSGRFLDFGVLSHRRLANFLGIGDLALLPSKHEPQGMAMLECMSAGCCLVSTRTGGIQESVEDGRSGILLDTRATPEEFGATLATLLENTTQRAAIATAARHRMENEFSWSRIAGKVESLYFQLAGHR